MKYTLQYDDKDCVYTIVDQIKESFRTFVAENRRKPVVTKITTGIDIYERLKTYHEVEVLMNSDHIVFSVYTIELAFTPDWTVDPYQLEIELN